MKYQRFILSFCNVIRIRKFEFVAKTQFLYREKLIRHKLRREKLEKGQTFYKGDNPPQCLGSILFWCKSGSWIRPEKIGTDYGSIIFFSAVWIWFWEQNVVLLVFLRPFYTLGSGSGNPTIYGLTNSYRHISEWQTATGQFPEKRIPEIRTRKIKFRSENFRVQWKIFGK